MSRKGARARDEDVGEGLDKGLVLEGHAGHLGLLQHDFRNEDVIGVSGVPPGQLPPLVMIKPVEVPAKSADGGGSDPARSERLGKWLHVCLSPAQKGHPSRQGPGPLPDPRGSRSGLHIDSDRAYERAAGAWRNTGPRRFGRTRPRQGHQSGEKRHVHKTGHTTS